MPDTDLEIAIRDMTTNPWWQASAVFDATTRAWYYNEQHAFWYRDLNVTDRETFLDAFPQTYDELLARDSAPSELEQVREINAHLPFADPIAPGTLSVTFEVGNTMATLIGEDAVRGFSINQKDSEALSNELDEDTDNEYYSTPAVDMVNHPPHYNSDPSGIACIEVTRHRNFNIGNAIKYLWRAGLKDDAATSPLDKQVEDLEKAIWYIKDEIGRLRGQAN